MVETAVETVAEAVEDSHGVKSETSLQITDVRTQSMQSFGETKFFLLLNKIPK
jgi:hypothetical protein